MKVASLDDLQAVKEMSMKFIGTTYFADYADERIVEELLISILDGDKTEKIVLFEENVGMLVGIASPFLYGPYLSATELGWWIEPEHRKSKIGKTFLEAFEHWAKDIAGCSFVVMGALDNSLDKFYEKKGYRLNEKTYMKKIW